MSVVDGVWIQPIIADYTDRNRVWSTYESKMYAWIAGGEVWLRFTGLDAKVIESQFFARLKRTRRLTLSADGAEFHCPDNMQRPFKVTVDAQEVLAFLTRMKEDCTRDKA